MENVKREIKLSEKLLDAFVEVVIGQPYRVFLRIRAALTRISFFILNSGIRF